MSSVTTSSAYVRRMIELESRGNGDQLNALERVTRRLGLKNARATRRLMNGERADVGGNLLVRIRAAYLDLCETQIRKLQDEIRAERAAFGDHHDLQNLDEEALALADRVKAARERLTR